MYSYFLEFRRVLETRKSFAGKMKRQGYPFYAMYGSGSMEAPFKVIWNRMGSSIDAVVVAECHDRLLGKVSPITQETLIFVPFQEKDAAHYLCAVLNSRIVTVATRRYSLKGSKSFASAHLLHNVKVPRFDSKNATHKRLVALSQECHTAAHGAHAEELPALENEIDRAAVALWGISLSQLEAICRDS